jgi:DNA-directed RNA polymerase subunit RPC12/RpoP
MPVAKAGMKMTLRRRIRHLERDARMGQRPETCSECGGRIIYAEHHEDGAVSYPLGDPCATCGSKRRIEVMLGDSDAA